MRKKIILILIGVLIIQIFALLTIKIETKDKYKMKAPADINTLEVIKYSKDITVIYAISEQRIP